MNINDTFQLPTTVFYKSGIEEHTHTLRVVAPGLAVIEASTDPRERNLGKVQAF